MKDVLMKNPCSDDYRDIRYTGKLINNFSVAPYIEDGNPKAMQHGQTCQCLKCKDAITIPAA
jgi:hypothetical protein